MAGEPFPEDADLDPAHGQDGYDVRVDWGAVGLANLLASGVRSVVVVDVLSFSTAVDVACGRGAAVIPFDSHDMEAAAAAAGVLEATLAGRRDVGGDVSVPSLSPVSLRNLEPGTRLLLPSPNGSRLSAHVLDVGVELFVGCIRNASAVAAAVDMFPLGIVAAGERWPDGSLRPALEDWIGAGAIAAAVAGGEGRDAPLTIEALFAGAGLDEQEPRHSLSPEAASAVAGLPPATRLHELLASSASGRELAARGYALDVEVAAALDVSTVVPFVAPDGSLVAR